MSRLAGEVVMSTAQELTDQGAAKGIAQGLETTRRLLRGQLEEKFAPLPADVQERLARASARQLEGWGREVLRARKLADVFGQATPRGTKRSGAGRRKR
ncbi:MAG: hypothetical protein M9894_03360 [Planctomycetes bacterium]|nr:hypothetical protein [Planctomycetota bacterium]